MVATAHPPPDDLWRPPHERPRTARPRSPDQGSRRAPPRARRSVRPDLPGRGEPDAIVVVADAEGQLRDLSWTPDADAEVRPVAADTEDGRSVIRHSAAHVLAQAVQEHVPARQARHRPADHRRLLLRLRRRRAVHPGGPRGAGEADAARSSRTVSCSPGASTTPRTRPARNWPTSPTSSNWSTTSPATPT